jgi:hypothetical protein
MADETIETPVPFDASALNDTDLYAEYATARERGSELAQLSVRTPEQSAELADIAGRATALHGEISARHNAASAEQANVDVFGALPELTAPVIAPLETAPEAPVTPPAAVEPVTVPSVAELGAQPLQPPAVAPIRPNGGLRVSLSADSAAVLGRTTADGATLDDISNASGRLFAQFGKSTASGEGRVRRSLGQIVRDRDPELVMPRTADPNAELAVINRARNERRLDGGSLLKTWADSVKANEDQPDALTAAAGWCAPSENRYDLCSLWDLDGLIDLPTTTAPRGGINYTPDFTWAAINDAAITSFTKLTEAQVIADTPKNCTELPCPVFTDRRLDVAVTCITGSFLQSHAYPEVVATWRDGLLTKHAYEVNKDIIQQILAFAPAPVVIPPQGATPAPGSGPDTSAASSLLSAIELAAVDMRERSNMSFNRTLEVVLPRWVLAVLRADIARRNAWHADPFALANQTIVSWFTTRGVRPQFIRGWQDAQSGLATGPGDITDPITPITAFPTTVNFLIYPAGAIVLAREDIITLTNVYDAASLRQNLYTALFTEEAYAPIFPCGEVREYTANICPSGATGAQVWTSCAVPAAAA